MIFVVTGPLGQNIQGHALWAYYPLWIRENGEKKRNPAFDQNSQHTLNIKQPGTPYYANSLRYCAKALHSYLQQKVNIPQAELVIIPSSKKGSASQSLDSIAKWICKQDGRFSYRPNSLTRTKTIEKLAKGGDRSLGVHLGSLDYKPGGPSTKIILDDVTTSGNSLTGAITIIHQYENNARFVPVVFGKTTHDF